MNAGRILCSILLGMYAIYIIRNNTITIAGVVSIILCKRLFILNYQTYFVTD